MPSVRSFSRASTYLIQGKIHASPGCLHTKAQANQWLLLLAQEIIMMSKAQAIQWLLQLAQEVAMMSLAEGALKHSVCRRKSC